MPANVLRHISGEEGGISALCGSAWGEEGETNKNVRMWLLARIGVSRNVRQYGRSGSPKRIGSHLDKGLEARKGLAMWVWGKRGDF